MQYLLSKIKAYLLLAALAGVVVTTALANASKSQQEAGGSDAIIYAQDPTVLMHKLDNHVNRNTDNDDDISWSEYQEFQEQAAHANNFLRDNRGAK